MGGYGTMLSREDSGAFMPLNINTSMSAMHVVCSIVPLCCKACYAKRATDSYMSQIPCWTWASTPNSQEEECQPVPTACYAVGTP